MYLALLLTWNYSTEDDLGKEYRLTDFEGMRIKQFVSFNPIPFLKRKRAIDGPALLQVKDQQRRKIAKMVVIRSRETNSLMFAQSEKKGRTRCEEERIVSDDLCRLNCRIKIPLSGMADEWIVVKKLDQPGPDHCHHHDRHKGE